MSSLEVSIPDYDKDSRKKALMNSGEIHFRSGLNFLNTHNGLRDNSLHLLMPPTHTGKSTVIRTILRDVIKNNHDKLTLVWLSEESAKDFDGEFAKCLDGTFDGNRFIIYSERDDDNIGETDEHFEKIENLICDYDIDFLIIDNITTAKNYMDKSVEKQSMFAKRLKGLLKMACVFVVAHTNGDNYMQKLLNENDIRGNKSITNLVEFMYILQPVYINNSLFQFIMLKKHRGQSADDKMFFLQYDSKNFIFDSDVPISFQDMKEKFNLRNKL